MNAVLILAMAALMQLPAPPSTATVRGRVVSETSGQPLAFATVAVVGGARTMSAVTNSDGSYVIRDVSPGLRLLRAEHLDHASLELDVLVPSGGDVLLELELALRPPLLEKLHVRGQGSGGPGDTVAATVPELGAATVRALESTPGMAELGLAEAARGAPSGHEPVDPSDVLYVRGAASDLKLVLLDGAPVYAPFHLGGLINPFEAGTLAGARTYVGGAPARYDGGLSYVMALDTRRARSDRVFFSGAGDMLSARAVVEAPLSDGAAVMFGARTVHDLAALRLLDHTLPYGYKDGLARADVNLPEGASLSLTGFWNREAISLDSLPGGPRDARWGNNAASLRLNMPFEESEGQFTIAYGGFNASLPVGGVRPLLVEGVARRIRLNGDFSRREGDADIRYGISFEQLRLQYKAWPRNAAPDSLLLEQGEEGSVGGGYVDVALNAGPRVRLRTGVRADMYSIGAPARVSPRLSATVFLSDHSTITLAGGKYSQYVRAPEPAIVAPSLPFSRPTAPPLALAGASHLVLSLDQELGELVRFGVDTYFKSYEGLPTTTTRTEASGIDLWLRRDAGAVTGWLGYSLGWIWSAERRPNLDFFAGRHLVSLGLEGPLGPEANFDVRFSYGAGLPFTAVPEPTLGGGGGPAPQVGSGGSFLRFDEVGEVPIAGRGLEEQYVRLDASLYHKFVFSMMGEPREIRPYVKVINALDRRDGLFYRYDGEGNDAQVVAALPILPILGLEWRF